MLSSLDVFVAHMLPIFVNIFLRSLLAASLNYTGLHHYGPTERDSESIIHLIQT